VNKATLHAALDTVDEYGVLTAYIHEKHMYSGKTYWEVWSTRDMYQGRISPAILRGLLAADSVRFVESDELGRAIYRPYREG
jgi:hypothetical protein